MNKVILIALVVLTAGASCSRNKKTDDIVVQASVNMEDRLLNFETTKKENGAHGGRYYSSIDSTKGFSAGYAYVLPDSLKNKNVTVYVSGWVRENELPLEGSIVITLTTSKGTVGWNALDNKKIKYNAGEWAQLKDSVTYTSDMLKDSYTEIGVIGMKPTGKDIFDLDDVQIKYKFSK